jgi:hypothetical protein
MDQNEYPGDLESKIEQAAWIASRIGDQTTVERLSAWNPRSDTETAAAS